MTGMYEGYINSIVPDIREKTSSSHEEKTWLDSCRNRVHVHLRADLESDMYVHMYICLAFMNGLI
jgi:hypothetical protein